MHIFTLFPLLHFNFGFSIFKINVSTLSSIKMPSKSSTKSRPNLPSSQRKSHKINPVSRTRLLPKSATTPHYLVVDTFFPSHIFNDRSLFTTYIPSRKVHRTPFGAEITIEGVGDVQVRVIVKGVSILFRFRNCWHVPSSHHHFLSCLASISLGNQVMIAGRTPRMIFPHKDRLLEPTLPKYMPFTRMDGYIILKFDIPTQTSVLPVTVPVPHAKQLSPGPVISLHASLYPPFAGLSVLMSPHLPTLSSTTPRLRPSSIATTTIPSVSLASSFLAQDLFSQTSQTTSSPSISAPNPPHNHRLRLILPTPSILDHYLLSLPSSPLPSPSTNPFPQALSSPATTINIPSPNCAFHSKSSHQLDPPAPPVPRSLFGCNKSVQEHMKELLSRVPSESRVDDDMGMFEGAVSIVSTNGGAVVDVPVSMNGGAMVDVSVSTNGGAMVYCAYGDVDVSWDIVIIKPRFSKLGGGRSVAEALREPGQSFLGSGSFLSNHFSAIPSPEQRGPPQGLLATTPFTRPILPCVEPSTTSVIAWIKYGPNVTIKEARTQDWTAKALRDAGASDVQVPCVFHVFTADYYGCSKTTKDVGTRGANWGVDNRVVEATDVVGVADVFYLRSRNFPFHSSTYSFSTLTQALFPSESFYLHLEVSPLLTIIFSPIINSSYRFPLFLLPALQRQTLSSRTSHPPMSAHPTTAITMTSNSSSDSLCPVDLQPSNVILSSPTKDHKSGNRASQHFRTTDMRLGSHSPNSIPSSPTSVHSSSSAIFERDIEPLIPPSTPVTHHHPLNPHRIPRSKATEQLENAVPTVIDSTAAILAGLEDVDLGDQHVSDHHQTLSTPPLIRDTLPGILKSCSSIFRRSPHPIDHI
jgi:hypothetical protein